jgi:hypothetical protein
MLLRVQVLQYKAVHGPQCVWQVSELCVIPCAEQVSELCVQPCSARYLLLCCRQLLHQHMCGCMQTAHVSQDWYMLVMLQLLPLLWSAHELWW